MTSNLVASMPFNSDAAPHPLPRITSFSLCCRARKEEPNAWVRGVSGAGIIIGTQREKKKKKKRVDT